MVTMTKKYKEAIALYPKLKGKKPIEVYGEMKSKGYEWDSYNLQWIDEDSKQSDLSLIDLNFSTHNDLIDDALELIQDALSEYGFEIVKNGRPQPAQEKDTKGNFIKSKTRSKVYFQLAMPEDNQETEETEEE